VLHSLVALLYAQVQAFAAANNIKLLYIPAGHTSTLQPLDTHINGIIKGKLSIWTRMQLQAGRPVTLLGRKQETSRILRTMHVATIRTAFDETLVGPAQEDRSKSINLSQEAQAALASIDSLISTFTAESRQPAP
jgi:hypothetical protein